MNRFSASGTVPFSGSKNPFLLLGLHGLYSQHCLVRPKIGPLVLGSFGIMKSTGFHMKSNGFHMKSGVFHEIWQISHGIWLISHEIRQIS